jgi:hypothetical protein
MYKKCISYVIFVILCGFVEGWFWKIEVMSLWWDRTTRYDPAVFFLNKYTLLIHFVMALIVGWVVSLFFRQRRAIVGIFYGFLFFGISLLMQFIL